jgi:hypothetical protein
MKEIATEVGMSWSSILGLSYTYSVPEFPCGWCPFG